MGILEWAILGLIGVLIILLVYETRQYRKYVDATEAVMGMGRGMQEGFNEIVKHLNRLSQDSLELRQNSALTDQELTVIRQVLELHGEKLDMQLLTKLFQTVDKLKAIENE